MKVKKSKKLLIIISAVVVVIGVYFAIRISQRSAPSAYPVGSVDFSGVQDGAYTGKAKNGIVRVDVSVAVKNGEVTNIDILKHFTGKGRPAEVITQDVINAQSLEVDAISSATLSSKTILQAIENALTGQE